MLEYGEQKDKRTLEDEAAQGSNVALYTLGFKSELGVGEYEGEKGSALGFYQLASERGHLDSSLKLANAHSFGRLGLEIDLNKAEALIVKAINQGAGSRGYFEMGRLSEAQNKQDQALKFYRKVVDENDQGKKLRKFSEMRMAAIYSAGVGVEQDHSKSLELYKEAALGGSVIAANEVSRIYRDGIGVEKNEGMANRWSEIVQESKAESGYEEDSQLKSVLSERRLESLLAAKVRGFLTGNGPDLAVTSQKGVALRTTRIFKDFQIFAEEKGFGDAASLVEAAKAFEAFSTSRGYKESEKVNHAQPVSAPKYNGPSL